METDSNIVYIRKYIDNQCNREEFDIAYDLIVDPASNEKYDDVWFEQWMRCMNSNPDTNSEISETAERKFNPFKILKYAAILIILMASVWLTNYILSDSEPAYTENFTTRFIKEQIDLSDGSKVILGAGSQLRISDSFDRERDLQLIGEATFSVENVQNSSFQVHTSSLIVSVIGTSFNIRNFELEPTVLVTVESGEVEVRLKDDNSDKSYFLTPDMQLIYDKKNQTVQTRQVNSKRMLTQNSNTLHFDQTPIYQIITDIERQYDVRISYADSSIIFYQVSGEHSNESLDELLSSLCFVNDFTYERVSDHEIFLLHK
ncbi:MAG: FecR family protein [Bacteroidales bacterium]|nr:FecR family protein [Bacteroidales bacterium]